MDEKRLAFIQIFFEDWHINKLYDFAIPYKNPDPDKNDEKALRRWGTMENAIIADLVPYTDAEFISICSWRLKQKRGDGPTPIILKNQLELSEEKILSTDFDIAILTPRNHKDIIQKLYMWHGEVAVEAISELRKFTQVPDVVDHAIYENHFIARKDIYQSYVKDALAPAIAFMDERPVFMRDSGYINKKRDPQEVETFKKKTGWNDWPIAPFILERLFSIWSNKKGYKVINL